MNGPEEHERAFNAAQRRTVNARKTKSRYLNFSDLETLDKLPRLFDLEYVSDIDFSFTDVSDIGPLVECPSLESVNLSASQVSDLTPLRHLPKLSRLYASYTGVSDISCLSPLTKLVYITLDETQIEDLGPLRSMSFLAGLSLAKTQIANLGPLAELASLASLDIRNSKVIDLSPLCNLVTLIDGAEADEVHGGLKFRGCPLTDLNVQAFVELENPERTICTINYLRERRGLQPYVGKPSVLALSQTEQTAGSISAGEPPPVLPSQGSGPHFALRQGIIDVAAPGQLDREGNNADRLRRLRGALADAAHDLLDALSGSAGNLYPQLRARAATYDALISLPLDEVDFALLYAAGLRLENAETAADREISDGIVPALEDHQYEALKTVSTLHGVFISATVEGQELLADAERFAMTAGEVEANKLDIIDILRPLTVQRDIVAPTAPQAILDLVEDNANVRHPERRVSYSYAAVSNLTLVLSGYAITYTVAGAAGWASAVAALAATGAHTALSNRGKDARKFAAELVSDSTDLADKALQDILRKGSKASRDFILRHEAPLRRLAARNRRFKFLAEVLDWLQHNGI